MLHAYSMVLPAGILLVPLSLFASAMSAAKQGLARRLASERAQNSDAFESRMRSLDWSRRIASSLLRWLMVADAIGVVIRVRLFIALGH